jgi:hypothetical protein
MHHQGSEGHTQELMVDHLTSLDTALSVPGVSGSLDQKVLNREPLHGSIHYQEIKSFLRLGIRASSHK